MLDNEWVRCHLLWDPRYMFVSNRCGCARPTTRTRIKWHANCARLKCIRNFVHHWVPLRVRSCLVCGEALLSVLGFLLKAKNAAGQPPLRPGSLRMVYDDGRYQQGGGVLINRVLRPCVNMPYPVFGWDLARFVADRDLVGISCGSRDTKYIRRSS